MCFDAHNKIRLKINHTLNPLVTVKKLLIWRKINMKLVNSFTKLLSSTSKLKTVHLQGFWSKTCISKKNRASSRLLAKNRVSQVFWDPIKNRVSPRSVLLKAVYLEALLYIVSCSDFFSISNVTVVSNRILLEYTKYTKYVGTVFEPLISEIICIDIKINR